MKLKRFRVNNFRSVEDSGWIDAENVTAFIGANESGKTNLLLPLWKLNPAKGGEINPTSDFPRKHYNDFRNAAKKPVFITAVFELDDTLVSQIVSLTGAPETAVRIASVTRNLEGKYGVVFPQGEPNRTIPVALAKKPLSAAEKEIASLTPSDTESDLAEASLALIREYLASLKAVEVLNQEGLRDLDAKLQEIPIDEIPEPSAIVARFERLRADVRQLITDVSKKDPGSSPDARKVVIDNLPYFVYYSNYGNLDSEIYLPHVIENMKREGLGAKEAAKARTLKVLFSFVGLQADEILELGKDFPTPTPPKRLTDTEIQQVAEKKKQRSILMQSASTKLTTEFRNWWRQGNYRFRFEADGDHFRIWVSDDQRPEEVELEGRSTGLQWFLSFYLVFLVESQDSHEGAILLLDEPGLSLHPIAQRDLSAFFNGLSESNQLLYTTHSPFLVDADHLDRARKVYVAEDGTSKATADLNAPANDKSSRAAGYAVFAALGLTVAESLLIGCEPIIVEGTSDQVYLSAIKTKLIALGKITPGRELVFPPAGGAKGVKAVASLLSGRDERLPIALFDADEQGLATAKQLKETLYAGAEDRLLTINSFITMPGAETEDLIPPALFGRAVDYAFRQTDEPFQGHMMAVIPIVDQVQDWAKKQSLRLPERWKVDVAKRVKHMILDGSEIPQDFIDVWTKLFHQFISL